MRCRFYLGVIFFVYCFTAAAQTTEAEEKLRKIQTPDSLLGWKRGGFVNIGFAQTSLTNWAAGGQSSVASNGLISVFAHRNYKNGLWENFGEIAYGVLRQGETGAWLKTDDRIDFSTKYGQRLRKGVYFASFSNFRTQFTDGFNPKDLSERISSFLAPGYWVTAVGMEYKPHKSLSLFLAPLTSKNTFVLDSALSQAGAFGVTAGQRFRAEFGGYLRVNFNKEVMQNVTVKTQLDLFSNYLNLPQNIDVAWDVLFTMKVNKFITTTLGTTLLYDHDVQIRTSSGVGPRTQFRQLLSVGFGYKLNGKEVKK